MFNKFIKKSSKFFAVLLTATLAFTPLSYGAGPSTFADLGVAISDGTTPNTITLDTDIYATSEDYGLGDQGANELTINGGTYTVDGHEDAFGIRVGAYKPEGSQEKFSQITNINNGTYQHFLIGGGDGSVINNDKGVITITGSSFKNNIANGYMGEGEPTGKGGVITHNTGDNKVGGRIGSLTINSSTFEDNTAFAAGAILSTGVLNIIDSVFKANTASYFGAMAIMGSKDDTTTISGTTFNGNIGTDSGGFPNAGAIFMGEEVDVTISDSKFEGNISMENGGAINTQPMSDNPELKYSKLDIIGSTFTANKAGFGYTSGGELVLVDAEAQGGAINNYYYNSNSKEGYVYVANSKFVENSAVNGGAIYNHGNVDGNSEGKMWIENTEFLNNNGDYHDFPNGAMSGGAIYNEGTMVIKDSVFGGEDANNTDIYNTGTLTILGDVSMIGGIETSVTSIAGEYPDGGITTIGDGETQTVLTLNTYQTMLTQKTLNVLANAELSVFVGKVNVGTINNDGLITVNGDTSYAGDLLSFTGTGRIVYTGNITYGTDTEIDANVEQSTVTVSADKTLTIGEGGILKTNSIDGGAGSEIAVAQGGKLVLNLNEESTLGVESLTGDGIFEVNASETDKTLEFASGSTISVSTIVATGDKHLVLSGASITSDVINNTTGESLELQNTTVEGDIYNYPGSPDTTMGDGQPVIDISDGVKITGKITNSSGTINVWGESFSVLNTVTSTQTANIEYNVLNIGDADNYSIVTSSTTESKIEYQTINVVNGILTLQGTSADPLSGGIHNSSITVTTNSRLTANASSIENTSIQNDGLVTFAGGTNNNVIDGEGVLEIEGVVENAAGTTITQSNIEIGNAPGKKLTAFADDIQAAVSVFGDGTYDVTGGTISYRVVGSGNVNIGTAEVKISSTIYKSNINISTSVIVDKESYLGDSSETASNLTINTGAKIDMKNDTVGTATINSITVNPSTEWTLLIDADLAAKTADNFVILDTENSSIGADSQATIDTVNFLTDFEEGQVDAKMQIANANINLQLADPLNIFKLYTTESSYDISTINDETGSFLNVVLSGLGTLPQAIYDGADEYSATRDEEITAWIDDVNTLSNTLYISGNNKTIKATPESGLLEGINTSTYTLTIDNLAGFEGFNNAVTVSSISEYTGFLNVSTVTFKNNTGDAVIKNAGYASLRNVTFEENEVNADVENIGELLITGTAGETSFEKGIVGIGTTTVTGTTVNFGGDAKFEQASISIEEGSQVTVNAANVKVTGINNILYNSGSLVLYSTATDTIDFANPIMDVISAGTTTIKTENNIGANINMGDNDLQQYGLIIEEGSSLTVNANKLNISSQVVNDGSLIFKSATSATEAMVNKSTITTTAAGALIIDGNVINQEGTGITQGSLSILETSSFTANVNDLAIEEGIISNEGNLIFKSETDVQTNENDIYGNGKFFIDGSLINRAEVNQSSVTIGSSIDSMVINEGAIVSTNVVINEGSTLVAKGEIDTYGDGEFENGKITNNGTFIINVLNPEGEPDTVPNYNTIDGTGTLIISSTNFNVQDNATISQSSVTIADVDSSLKVGVSSITVSPDGAVQNAGKFILTGEGTNENKVTYYNGTYGEIIFDEGSQIINNANIVQSTITIKGTVTNTNGS
ncbi:MAG: hypothetical protein IKN42_07360, partial [Elusimicrobia bacterium]|nr:hypothetical protein [Elusimicrobiota bacterium]